MKALKYHLERRGIAPSNVLTEFVNSVQARLNDDQHVIGDNPPYWELDSTTTLPADGQGAAELLFTFVCWQERY